MNSGRSRILLLALLITGSTSLLYSQAVYVNTEQGIFQMPDGTGNSNRILINNGCGDDSNVLSLAVYKDTVYYNTWAGELKRFKAGVPGSCETLLENMFSYNSMTVDKNGIIYMATEMLVRYDPYTRQLTELGRMPFYSAGDMLFFQDKLLLAGWDPEDWSSGIFEINPDNLPASKLYMSSPTFFGLLSYPVPCGNSRYFGLSPVGDSTTFIEIDLANKIVTGNEMSVPEKILDGGSIAETGIDDKIKITGVVKTSPDVCRNENGSITLSAFSRNNPVTFTLLNTGISQSSGKFSDLRGGLYRFRITDAAGCSKDTSIAMAENMPLTGCKDIFIPNAFTPNNDGKNDLFTITLSSFFKDASLQIFNRWGNIVHQSKGSTMAWDGYNKGAQQPAGIYIYTVSYTSEAGEKKILKGTLALIK